jgi:ABC-2 type transport system permease protein
MNRVLALLWKDLRLFFGDRKAMLITFLVPIGIASFFASIMPDGSGPSKSTKIPVLVVDNDGSPLVAKVVDGLRKDSMADPKLASEADADASVKTGTYAVAVVFPKGFAKDAPQAMFNGTAPTVELKYDPSRSMEMQAVQGSIMQVAMQTVSQSAFSANQDYSSQMGDIDRSTRLTPAQKATFHAFFSTLKSVNAMNVGETQSGGGSGMRQPFKLKATPQTAAKSTDDNADYSGLAHSFAGMAMQGVLFYAINAAMAMLTDRRKGIWRRLRASPVGLVELLAGKALSSALIGGVVLAGVLGFGMLVFHLRVQGSWLGLGLVLVASALMTATFGLLVASLGRTEEQSRGLSILAVLTMVMLGGGWFPSFMMPEWVQKLSLIVPVRWALDGFDAMLWRGQSLAQALTPVAGLLIFTVIFGVVAAFRFKTMPETA